MDEPLYEQNTEWDRDPRLVRDPCEQMQWCSNERAKGAAHRRPGW